MSAKTAILELFMIRTLAPSSGPSKGLLQITDIRCNGFDLPFGQAVRNRFHDSGGVWTSRVLTALLTPIRQCLHHVGVELTRQTWNLLLTRSLRAVTGSACRHIVVGHAVLKDLFSRTHEFPGSVRKRLGIESSKIPGESRHHCRIQDARHMIHDVIRAPVLNKGSQLILEVLGLLSRKSWDGIVSVITLPRKSVALLTVLEFGLKAVLRSGGRVCAACAACRHER